MSALSWEVYDKHLSLHELSDKFNKTGVFQLSLPMISQKSLSESENSDFSAPILETVLAGFDVTFHETVDAGFVCDCSAERVERSLCSLGDEDVADIIADGKPIEVKCQFCNKAYNYTVDELIEMRKRK